MMHHLGAIPASSPSPCLMGGLAAARIFQQSRPSQKVTRCDGPRATSPRYKAAPRRDNSDIVRYNALANCTFVLWSCIVSVPFAHTHTHGVCEIATYSETL